MNKFLKKYRNDFIIIFSVLLAAFLIILTLRLTAKGGKNVKVLIDGEEKYRLSLSENIEKIISQNGQENILIIKNGKAKITSASCPDKICVSHKAISKSGETIICLPNKVVVEIE